MSPGVIAVVTVICVGIVIIAVVAAIKIRKSRRKGMPWFAEHSIFSIHLCRQVRSERRGKQESGHGKIQEMSSDKVLSKLKGSRAEQNYMYACEYLEAHGPDESEGRLSDQDLEYVIEHGASAWEFKPEPENTGITVRNRTEVEFSGGEQALVANLQFPNEQRVYYFEVRLDELHGGTNVAVGVAMKGYPSLRMAGWAKNSVAYHTIDGCTYYAHPLDVYHRSMTAHTSDTLGVGWRPNSGKMFFAINGAIICHVRTPWAHKRMYPIISADGPCSVSANFGARAFILSHANMRYWGLASSEGMRLPPPMYQTVSETLLLAASPSSEDDAGSTSNHMHPPSYDDSEANSRNGSVVGISDIVEAESMENDPGQQASTSTASLLKECEGSQRCALEIKFCEYANRVGEILVQLSENAVYSNGLKCAQEALVTAWNQRKSGDAEAAVNSYIRGLGYYQDILSAAGSAKASSGTAWVRGLRRSAKVERLEPEELQVVKRTSSVNGLTFLPWLDDDLGENFVLQDYYTDKDGLLMLSQKQQRKLSRWRRASQIYSSPQIFGEVGCSHIVQETVTDCSFVAALCVSVEYERKFNRQLITQNIYPQGPSGKPVFNPCGKYMVKLFINGFWRRVVIDDLLPVAENGRLMCTYSAAGDIGQSLIEKAFLKVMGGYDFPGSNSSTDLHVLTGWIPEHIFIQSQSFNADRTWKRMCDGSRNGDVLLTIATGEMSSELASTLGLVPSHAYAVLDVREVCGHRLLKVKNPWSSTRWTGTFSHKDRQNWTAELMQLLSYDPAIAEVNDRGIFWIDYESVCHRFDAIHLNWNPAVFSYRTGVHFEWELSMGPRQALYDFSANPQYTLKVDVNGSSNNNSNNKSNVNGNNIDSSNANNTPEAALSPLVWVLLSKHVLRTEENKDFIALHVYDGKGGCRIYEPRSAMRVGEYVNVPHALVQFTATPGETYTLVVAQKDKTKSLYFTLRAFCDMPICLQRAPLPQFLEEIQGQWGSGSAGGNAASPRYLDNPQYRLTVKSSSNSHPRARFSGIVTLESTQKHPVNLRVFRGGFLVTRVLEINSVTNSGKYRARFCTCLLDSIDEGSYTIVASTFEPFMFSRFKLSIGLDAPFSIAPIPREGAGMRLRELRGRWTPGTDSMGGPVNQFYNRNPRFLVRTERATSMLVRLQTPQAEPLPLVNVSVFALDGPGSALGHTVASSGSYTNSPQGVATRLATIGDGSHAEYLVVASTWDVDADAPFVLYFYSEHAVEIEMLSA
ncbi:cysteine protease [Dipsacomyces acuminosporus]|nr:cysteine protease [Dipsacomyces acuminosporus]